MPHHPRKAYPSRSRGRLTGPVMGKHKTADAPGGARKAWPELYTAGRLFNGEYRKQHHRALQSIPQNPLRKARQPDRHALPHGGHRAHRRPLREAPAARLFLRALLPLQGVRAQGAAPPSTSRSKSSSTRSATTSSSRRSPGASSGTTTPARSAKAPTTASTVWLRPCATISSAERQQTKQPARLPACRPGR